MSTKIEMQFTALGMYEARVKNGQMLASTEESVAAAVCPFSASASNEDQIAADLFGGSGVPHPQIGYSRGTFSGSVTEGGYREAGSSGGMGTWIASELLRLDLVDAILHVRPAENSTDSSALDGAGLDGVRPSTVMFEYAFSHSLEALRSGAHSHYYPVTLAGVLDQVRTHPGLRYALVGTPCFIKAARLVARHNMELANGIRFHIGLVCGHLKSSAFAELLGWQAGIPPSSLTHVDFRVKLSGRSPRHYGFRASGSTVGGRQEKPMSEVFGGDWGLGFFKYKACSFCDDVFAETADLVIGDAWLPRFDHDWRGTNIVIVRHPTFARIIDDAVSDARVDLKCLPVDETAASQRAGLRDRREGLSWRLADADRQGRWHPPKRVVASSAAIPAARRRVFAIRESLRAESHAAFAEAKRRGDLEYFTRRMAPAVKRYYDHLRPVLWRRILNRLRRIAGHVAR